MIRKLVGFFALLLVFLVVRSALSAISAFFKENMSPAKPESASEPVGGELKKDPVCGTYVPAATSLSMNVKGEVVHFCSQQCRDKYIA